MVSHTQLLPSMGGPEDLGRPQFLLGLLQLQQRQCLPLLPWPIGISAFIGLSV